MHSTDLAIRKELDLGKLIILSFSNKLRRPILDSQGLIDQVEHYAQLSFQRGQLFETVDLDLFVDRFFFILSRCVPNGNFPCNRLSL